MTGNTKRDRSPESVRKTAQILEIGRRAASRMSAEAWTAEADSLLYGTSGLP